MSRTPWFLLLLLSGCSTSGGPDGEDEYGVSSKLNATCTEAAMAPVMDALAQPNHPCHAWVASLVPRVGRVFGPEGRGAGAGAIAWRAGNVAVFATSRHEFLDPPLAGAPPTEPIPGVLAAPPHAYRPSFGVKMDASPAPPRTAWRLFSRPIPQDQTLRRYNALRPENDFVLAVLTGQPATQPSVTGPSEFNAVPLDADSRAIPASRVDALATVTPGATYMAIGTWGSADLFYSVGKADPDAEAATLLRGFSAIDYDPNVEFLVRAESYPGMSGAGVFDVSGRLVGTLVRGGKTASGVSYFRAVRSTFIAQAADQAVSLLPAEAASAAQAYLSPNAASVP